MTTASASEQTATEMTKGDVMNQENVSAKGNAPKQSSKQQVRHRASVACASCRERRIRCVVPKGDSECTQCKRTGTECVIKNDDERRRPISKAYMSSLTDRISMLEGLLLDKGVVPPPTAHPPKSRHEPESDQQQQKVEAVDEGLKISPPQNESHSQHPQMVGRTPIPEVPSPPDSATHDDFAIHDSPMAESVNIGSADYQALPKEPSPFRFLDSKQEDIVHRLLSTKGNLSFDQLSGRLRFFGPTANSHVYAESSDKFDSREPPEQIRRAERIIRSLTSSTYDYLMSVFWEYYNDVIYVIDREAFEADRESQNPKLYSSFLHITILAMAYRFSDKTRDDMIKISIGNRESTLHREAKYMLDVELERPGGVPSVQALLILGDLECGVGRDNTGWMYSGMANRLAFDIGLHLDCSNNGLPEQEVRIRHMVMRACVIFDKYWALFLGRPTSIKNQDIGMDLLSRQFTTLMSKDRTVESKSTKPVDEKALKEEIFEQLVELMELAGRIVEIRDTHSKFRSAHSRDHNNTVFSLNEAEDHAYLHAINLDRQLQNWYRRLPTHLTWKPANIKSAPYSFFLLHQQYHVTMILLHRPWAKYRSISDTESSSASSGSSHSSPAATGSSSNNGSSNAADSKTHPSILSPDSHHHNATGHALGLGEPTSLVDDSRTSLSRSICTQQAIRVSRIFWQHRQRFDGRRICVTGIQHAGTAAIALIAAFAYQPSEADRRSYLGYLEVISSALHDMSDTYHPASRMDDLLSAVLVQLRGNHGNIHGGMGGYYHGSYPGGEANLMQQHSRTNSFSGGMAGVTHNNGSNGGSLYGVGQNLWEAAGSFGSGVYSVLPARRENPDSSAGPNKRSKGNTGSSTRPTPGRRASEFTRPRPSFFSSTSSSMAPPATKRGDELSHHDMVPGSNGDGGGAFGEMTTASPFGSGLEVLGGDEGGEDGRQRNAGDDFVLINGPGSGNNHHHDEHWNFNQHQQQSLDFGFLGPDWGGVGGPAGLSASTVLGDSNDKDGAMSSSVPTLGAGLGSRLDSGAKEDPMEWVQAAAEMSPSEPNNGNVEGGDNTTGNALSPTVSLNGLVQSVEKLAGEGDHGSPPLARNHELDFFSF